MNRETTMRTIFRNSSLLCATLFTAIALWFAVQMNYGNLIGDIVPLICVLIALVAAGTDIARRGGNVDWTVTGGLGIILFAGYLVTIHILGFLMATPIFVLAVFLATETDKKRALIVGAVFGVLLAASVYFLFVVCMGNLLPMGMFE